MLLGALRKLERELGPSHPALAMSSNELGILLIDQGRLAEAEPHILRALRLLESVPDRGGPKYATVLSNLGMLRREQGRVDEAAALAAQVVAIREQTIGAAHPDVALERGVLAELAILRGLPDEARQHLAKERPPGALAPLRAIHALRKGGTELELGDLKAAATTLRDAADAALAEYGATSPERLQALTSLFKIQLERGDMSAAEATVRAMEELQARLPAVPAELRLAVIAARAQLLRLQGIRGR